MTITPAQELETWFQERPKWLQDAARRLAQNSTLSEQDFTELLSICLAEANGQAVGFSGIPAGGLGVQDLMKPLRLESIQDVQGINALCLSRPFSFGDTPLCIVYGRNGAGKSGYVRLLKHVCGVRRPGELLNDIFEANPRPQTAKFTYTEDPKTKEAKTVTSLWSGKPLPELRGVDIYDTACGLMYVNDENEVTFEPWLLRLFTQLTRVCEILSQRIQVQIQAKISKKPVFPQDYSLTSAAAWYANLTANTATHEVDDKTTWASAHEADLTEITRRLAETNPAAKVAELLRQKSAIIELLAVLKNLHEEFSADKCAAYIQARADAKVKRKAADDDAQKIFEQAPLHGIGSESWRLLWEAARTYSTEHAYKSGPFPNIADDARCVLCQQKLDPESRDRFRAFKAFVIDELQKQAREAEQLAQSTGEAFPDVPTVEILALRVDAAGITDDNDRKIISDYVAEVAKRKDTCFAASSIGEVAMLPNRSSLVNLARLARKISKQARTYEKDAKNENRPQLERARTELLARQWLSQQRQAINDEITRLCLIHTLKTADDLTNTMALSKRKSILSEDLVTKAYIRRFEVELKSLKADRLPVELKKTRADIGHVYHKLFLTNACSQNPRTSDILSEGEFRIISLAAFLADTGSREAKTPFIFDDPISSLDQVYEDAAAQRLVSLSKTRQVIVFTHRLSMVGLLEKYTDKENVDKTIVCLSRIRTGDIAELPITLTKTKPTANRFLNDRIKMAKTAFLASDAEYEKEAKALCRDIRILLEQIVETDLLAGIVRRYNPEVQTKGKIEHLAKITPEDCTFIDEMMTTYSRYEHSQPDEAPVELPKPDDLQNDLKAIAAFIESVQQRKKQ